MPEPPLKPTYVEKEKENSHAESSVHHEPLYYPGKKDALAIIPLIQTLNGSKSTTATQKKLGRVLEEFKNRSVLSLLENGGKFELSGPYYIVTPAPLHSRRDKKELRFPD